MGGLYHYGGLYCQAPTRLPFPCPWVGDNALFVFTCGLKSHMPHSPYHITLPQYFLAWHAILYFTVHPWPIMPYSLASHTTLYFKVHPWPHIAFPWPHMPVVDLKVTYQFSRKGWCSQCLIWHGRMISDLIHVFLKPSTLFIHLERDFYRESVVFLIWK